MSIWFVIPSIRPNGGTIPLWRERGYKVACLRQGDPIDCELQIPTGEYHGWAPSVNILAKWVVEHDPTAEWIVTGGDDYEPDMAKSPEEIACECSHCFWKLNKTEIGDTFGIMQPSGDRWGDTPAARKQYGEHRGAYLDRIAGSPWMGREWVKRAYQGNGPMFAGYRHMYADEELKEVAEKLGVYWARRDIIQLHQHWGRKPGDEFADIADCPDFLRPVNTPQHWHESQRLFVERKAAGWPGSEPL
jgi:hypothetical protein